MTIPLIDLAAEYDSIKTEVDTAIQQVLKSTKFILGPNVHALEEEIAECLGVRFAVGVASGTDALILALRALDVGPGDEVIVPAYTFFATAEAVMNIGATPVFADVDPATYCLDAADVEGRINARTKAIIPVHLYGHPAEMNAIGELAKRHNIKVVEDNAQAFGAEYRGRKTGGLGDAGCLSFFPSKNLGGYGDGGMVVTNSEDVADRVRMLRTHGWRQKYLPEMTGYNSRLDEIQAAILRVKLKRIESWNEQRRHLAAEYGRRLAGNDTVAPPMALAHVCHVYHMYMVRSSRRDELQQHLKEQGIATAIYYPKPLHLLNPCRGYGSAEGDLPVSEAASRETLAIPMHPKLSAEHQERVVSAIQMMSEKTAGAPHR